MPRFLFILLLLLLSASVQGEITVRDSGSILLDKFSCQGVGSESKAVGANIARLRTALNQIQFKEEKCKDVQRSISKLPDIEEIENLISSQGIYQDLEQAEKQLNELQTDLQIVRTTTPPPDGFPPQDYLINQLQFARSRYVELKIKVDVEKGVYRREQYISGINQLSSLSTRVLQSLKSNQDCMDAAPEATQGLLTSLVGIAGFFMKPAQGLVTAIGGKIVNEAFALADRLKSDRIAKSFEGLETAELMAGLSCTLQTLGKHQCNILRDKSLFDRINAKCEDHKDKDEKKICLITKDKVKRSRDLADSAARSKDLSGWLQSMQTNSDARRNAELIGLRNMVTQPIAQAELSHAQNMAAALNDRDKSPLERKSSILGRNMIILSTAKSSLCGLTMIGSAGQSDNDDKPSFSSAPACVETGARYLPIESYGGSRCLALLFIEKLDTDVQKTCENITAEYLASTGNKNLDTPAIIQKRASTDIETILSKSSSLFLQNNLNGSPKTKAALEALSSQDIYPTVMRPKLNEIQSIVNQRTRIALTPNEQQRKAIEFIEGVDGELSSPLVKARNLLVSLKNLPPGFLKRYGYDPEKTQGGFKTAELRDLPNDPLHLSGIIDGLERIDRLSKTIEDSGDYSNNTVIQELSKTVGDVVGPQFQLTDNLNNIYATYNKNITKEIERELPDAGKGAMGAVIVELDRMRLQDAAFLTTQRMGLEEDYTYSGILNEEALIGFEKYFSKNYVEKVLKYFDANKDRPSMVNQKNFFCLDILLMPKVSENKVIMEACKDASRETPQGKISFSDKVKQPIEKRVCVLEDARRFEHYRARNPQIEPKASVK